MGDYNHYVLRKIPAHDISGKSRLISTDWQEVHMVVIPSYIRVY